jgi:hypothetical protein
MNKTRRRGGMEGLLSKFQSRRIRAYWEPVLLDVYCLAGKEKRPIKDCAWCMAVGLLSPTVKLARSLQLIKMAGQMSRKSFGCRTHCSRRSSHQSVAPLSQDATAMDPFSTPMVAQKRANTKRNRIRTSIYDWIATRLARPGANNLHIQW